MFIFLIVFLFLLALAFFLLRIFEAMLPIMFWGAVYVPTKQAKIRKIIEMANIKPGDKAVDLGSGDGRLVIALAKAGAEAHGYEINPLLCLQARKNIRQQRLSEKAFIHCGSFWRKDFSDFDIITIYGMNHVMKRLEVKFKRELKANARVVSNGFSFPSWPYSRKEDDIYLYIK